MGKKEKEGRMERIKVCSAKEALTNREREKKRREKERATPAGDRNDTHDGNLQQRQTYGGKKLGNIRAISNVKPGSARRQEAMAVYHHLAKEGKEGKGGPINEMK